MDIREMGKEKCTLAGGDGCPPTNFVEGHCLPTINSANYQLYMFISVCVYI